jgi:FKBP12-rapamycin complex-associated protein
MDKYDKLPIETKVARLQAALAHSKQTDLKEVLWHRAPSAEVWIRRRTNFARTLGVGSECHEPLWVCYRREVVR